MAGVNIGGRSFVLCNDRSVLGPCFGVANTIEDGMGPFGGRNWDDIWLVPTGAPGGATIGASPCTQVTDNEPGSYTGTENYDDGARLSPCGRRIVFYVGEDVGTHAGDVKTINVDGSGEAFVDEGNYYAGDFPFWWIGDSESLVFNRFLGALEVVNVDTAAFTTPVSGGSAIGNPSHDGTRIAYVEDVGATSDVHVCDLDGSNDSVIATGAYHWEPVWTPDDSRVVYLDINGSATDLRSCIPDGTDDRLESANVSNGTTTGGFWNQEGIYDGGGGDHRLYYTQTTLVGGSHPPGSWRLGMVQLDGTTGGTIIQNGGDDIRVARASQRGNALARWQGRIFTIIDSSYYGFTEDFISVLPDGTDYRVHYAPAEGPGVNDLFQVPFTT